MIDKKSYRRSYNNSVYPKRHNIYLYKLNFHKYIDFYKHMNLYEYNLIYDFIQIELINYVNDLFSEF